MDFEDLKNTGLQERLKSASTAEELVALAREEGMELTDDQLESLSGGEDWICDGNVCDGYNCMHFTV